MTYTQPFKKSIFKQEDELLSIIFTAKNATMLSCWACRDLI
jgi:hypothetical protein